MATVARLSGSSRRVEPVSLIAGSLWVALAVAASWKCIVAPDTHTVFTKFAAGADHWWAGEPLYAEYEEQGDFRYSPTFAILMTPFAAIGPRYGAAVWVWVNVIAFIWGVRRLARDVLPGHWPLQREGALLLLTLPGALRGIWNGQSNALVAGLLIGGAAFMLRGRHWRAAALLALAICLKLSPIAMALLFAAMWPRKLGIPMAVMIAVVAIVPFLTQPPAVVLSQYKGWFAYLHGSSERRWPSFRDAWTVWELFRQPVHVGAYRLLQWATGLGILGWCLWQRRHIADPRLLATLVLAAGINYLMLFGPAVEFPTYAILAPLTAWGLLEAGEHRFGRPLMLAAYLMTSVLGFGAVERALAGHWAFVTATLPAGTFLFLVWLMGYARSRAQASNLVARPSRP